MNRKQIFLSISLLVIASMVLTACGAATATPPPPPPATEAPAATSVPPTAVPPTPTNEPVTLNIWHNWGPDDTKGAPLQSVFKDFMAANPDITIKDTVLVDADIPLKVETASTSKQEPDLVFSVLFDGVLNWADNGVAPAVNDYIKDWGLDGKFTDLALANFTQDDGKIRAFPLEGFTWPIWYNMKLFNEAGLPIPTTTDELIADAKIFREKGLGGPVIASGADGMGGALFNLIVQSQMTDAETIQAFGKGDWTIPNAIKGVELFVKLRDAGVFVDGVEGVDYASGNTRFFEGKVPMSHFGSWSYTDPAGVDLAPDVKLGGFPIASDSPWKSPVYYSGYFAKGVFVTPNGQAKLDAVKRFIQYLYQPDVMARFVPAGMTPPLKEVSIDKSTLPPLVGAALDLPNSGTPITTLDAIIPPEVGTDVGRIQQEAFAPGASAEKILADLTAAYAAAK
jgi:multiple sugar transport system substrate-binding protein